jgi:hypothetical protein
MTTVSAQTATGEAHVTFAKDVAPILQRSCQTCHRPEQMAPMSLLTYEEVRPWARSIRQKVSTREMPPFYADRTIGVQEFKNDPSLTEQEIATVVAWVDNGAPLGNPTDLPPPREFEDANTWTLPGGVPDLIVTNVAHTIEANSNEKWIDTFVEFTMPEDRWVKGFEARPGENGFPVVHHLIGGLREYESAGFSFQYAPGKPATIYPDGVGFLIKKGVNRMTFGLHYSSIDREVTDASRIAFTFYPKGQEPTLEISRSGIGFSNEDLDLPAGESNVRHDAYRAVTENTRVLSYLPHMHIHGKRECIEFIYPTGETETMSCVDFNFNWQVMYQYADHVQPLVPKGTIVHVTSWHDNSVMNENNPDAKNWKGYGQRTIDDMAIPIISGVKLTDEQFQAAQEERAAALASRTDN